MYMPDKPDIMLSMKIKRMTSILLFSFVISAATLTSIISLQAATEQENELFLVSQKAFEDGFYDVAMRYIDQLFNEYPETEKRVQANLILGQCYFFKSQYLKAYDIFQILLQYNEYKDATLFWLGETYLKGSDYVQAEDQYKKLIKLFPDSPYTPQAYYSLGWIYFEQSKYKQSKEEFQKLIQFYPVHQLTEDSSFKLGEIEFNLKEYENTIDFFKNYVVRFPKSSRHAQAYFYIAESYYYLGDYLTAVTYYAQAADIAYDNKLIIMAKVSLGWSYLKLGKLKLSQKFFDEALMFAQEKGVVTDDVYLGQANLYTEMGDHQKALESYTLLIQKFPNSQRILEAQIGLANSYYLLKNYEPAIKAYLEVINLSEDKLTGELLEKVYFGLAWSYLKENDIENSVKSFYAIHQKTTNNTVKISALTQIGDAYQDVGDYDKAIKAYDDILEKYPHSPFTDYVQYRQGIALLKMDKIETATLSFQSLQANFPDSKYLNDINYYLSVAYFKKESWGEAKKYITKFIDQLPETHEFMAEAKQILAFSCYNLGEYEQSIKNFQKIIKDHPDQSNLVENAKINIAKSYYKMGKIPEALKLFELIINSKPSTDLTLEALIWVADHYLEAADYPNAIIYYQRIIEEFPGAEKIEFIYFELGRAYQASEQFEEAVDVLSKISQQNPKLFARAKLTIAEIFSRELEPDSAIETYQNIINLSPEYSKDAYIKIAEVYQLKKDYPQAIEAYKNALKSQPGISDITFAEIQFHIADIYEILFETDRAIEEYLKISYLYPKETDWIIKSYLRLGRIFEDREEWEQAVLTYNKILKYNTDEVKFAQERLDWIKNNTE